MRGLMLALFLCLGPAASAQTVTFRSGNHAEFARVVLDITPGQDWAFGRAGEDYVLAFGPGLAFDLSGVFARIPRDRLRDIAVDADTGRLTFRIGCDCHATAFLFQPDKLVVDVTDGPPPPESPWETALPAAGPAAVRSLPLLVDQAPSLLFLPLIAPTTANTPPASPQLPDVDALAAGMARAVAAGVLEPAASVAMAAPPSPVDPNAMAEWSRPSPPESTPLPTFPTQPGIAFITADVLERTLPGAREIGSGGDACRPEGDFDLAAWGPTGDFAQDIGQLRQHVIDAAGALDGEAVVALARGYLHYGLGAEARQVLALADEDSTTHRLLANLADLIDGRPVAAGTFADQAGCLTAAALWSALAAGTIVGRSPEERTAIETAFRVLPPGPRQAVGPRLAGIFLAAGQADSAAALLGRIPAQASGTEEAIAVESDIIRDAASAAAARDALLAAIRNGSRASAGTMVRLVDATIAAELPVESWMIETLAALRFEHSESPMSRTLAVAELEALVASGRFTEANSLLADARLPIDGEERSLQGAALARALAARGSDTEFLDVIFSRSFDLAPGAPANAVAERLIALGFPDVGLDILAPPAESGAMAERRRLRAAALRALGQDEEAARVLTGSVAAGDAPVTAAAAWRAGDWEAIRQADDPLLRAVAEGVLEDAPPAPTDDSLASRAALVTAAAETRRLADELLARFPAPDPAVASPGGQP
jgi:hypothetical protein